jgi:6-pyruvoyltetrahydropterin/6-carboxytetrahydropterin synthase
MIRAALLRVVHFHATHHYRRRDWSDEENARVFGALTEPHGHAFRVEVRVEGLPDPHTGFVVDLSELDRILREEVVEPLDGAHLNDRVPDFREGGLQPCTEALARWLGERIGRRLPAEVHLERIQVWESDDLGAEVRFTP